MPDTSLFRLGLQRRSGFSAWQRSALIVVGALVVRQVRSCLLIHV